MRDKIQEVIDKHKKKHANMTEHRKDCCDFWDDKENRSADEQIVMMADFVRELRKLRDLAPEK